MKRDLLKLLTCFYFFALVNFQAKATNNLGATISYTNIAPGTYFVTLKKYRECTMPASPSANLNINASGCNAGRTTTMNLVGQNQIVTPYCNLVPKLCGIAPNIYDIAIYNATVTFSASEQTCTDWVLSWSECCRPETENIVGVPNAYSEAFLKLGANINNNSAEVNILDEPIPVFCLNEDVQYILKAYDPDCDSLTYELVAPLTASNTPATYKAITTPNGNLILNPNPQPPFNNMPPGQPGSNPQVAALPVGYQNYSATFPLGSFFINWTPGQQIVMAQPSFNIHPATGVINFKPQVLMPDTVGGTKNRYLVSVLIKEWRKVNGIITQVGSIRRDLTFNVADCFGNKLPQFGQFSIPVPPGIVVCWFDTSGIFNVREGEQLELEFTAYDPNPNDTIYIETDLSSILPGAQLTIVSGTNPVHGRITWPATAFTTCDVVRYVRFKLSDNACPIVGKQDFMMGVRVVQKPLSVAEKINAKTSFSAFPNPFSEEVYFSFNQLKGQKIIIYNLLGQQIDEIPLKTVGLGEQKVQWQNAGKYANGTYVAKLISEDKTIQTLKLTKLQ